MFRAIKEYLKKIIPSKESYKQKVIANNKKNNGIIIGIIIILLIILMGMVIWCYMCKPKIYEYVGMIYLFLLLLVLFFYFITYLCSCEFNYYFFIAIMCLILIPLSPMYLLTIQYEKKFKLNVISIWDPVVFIALTLILA
ncbi:MAG: hypothetical protein IKP66_08040, partial [Lachnospiraceae bacterium]|nr:hypothetical protein [Lachnospiraceae bacterium]